MAKHHDTRAGKEKVNTPQPPQVMDPSRSPGKQSQATNEKKKDKPDTYEKVKKEKEAKPKLLGESETEITDETTI
jgi:hypothetical protein